MIQFKARFIFLGRSSFFIFKRDVLNLKTMRHS